ncbi:MAG TPA: NAD(P)-binding domain-containing protein [Cyclobacteriaceae bacterium]|nr:NAD(P)-binding domain-containing protein [Cyclobacteriaceae bacterium]
MNSGNSLPVGIIGAGPVGLAAAAHLAMRNQPFIMFEAGDTIAANVLSWKHIKVFSPWKYNIDKAARQLLAGENWQSPPDEELPTGKELYTLYFKPLAELPSIKPNLHIESRVLSIGRKNLDKMKTEGRHELPFVIQVLHHSEITSYEVKAVIDASGTWNSPNPIGAGGVYAEGEIENRNKIFYGIPDILNHHRDRYKNKSIVVVGSGHSAINAILELDKLKAVYPETEIHWILRKKKIRDIYGGQEKDALEARGALGIKIEQLVTQDRVNVYTPFQVQRIMNDNDKMTIIGNQYDEKFALNDIDEIISNTGSRPDFSFLREIRLNIDPALESTAELADLIDPNIHSCGTVRPHGEKELRHPDKDFYIVGSKSYGRAPTFLMATGYEQVRSIVAAIDGDVESALKVELDLPETGVCSTDLDSGCCGSSATKVNITTACCG